MPDVLVLLLLAWAASYVFVWYEHREMNRELRELRKATDALLARTHDAHIDGSGATDA